MNCVDLTIVPGKVVKPEEFREFPPFSVLLDGFGSGTTRFDPEGLVLNLNHHEDCDGLATRSTCLQSVTFLKMGLQESFRCKGKFRAHLYANDCDQDVVYATYAFMHRSHIDRPLFKAMIEMEDRLDSTAGLYPVKKRWHILRKLLWVTEPYAEARLSGELNGMSGDDMKALIEKMHRRIRDSLFGRGKEITPDTSYKVLKDFGDWQYVSESGMHARLGMGQAGITAFVSYLGKQGKGHRYVIGRRSKLIPGFPLPIMVDLLNKAEGIAPDATDRWGGNLDNIIGSPRAGASRLSPDRVLRIVEKAIALRKAKHPICHH